MRTIETALWPLQRSDSPADIGLGVYIGDPGVPELAGLSEGEHVLPVEPNELQAAATLHLVELGGRHVWFAEIGAPNAIQVIYPDSPSSSRRVGTHSSEAQTSGG